MRESERPGQRLKQLLQERGLKQIDLARKVGKTERTVIRWINQGQGFDEDQGNQMLVVHALGLAEDVFYDPKSAEALAQQARETLEAWFETDFGRLATEKQREWLRTSFRFPDPEGQPTFDFFDVIFAAAKNLVPFEQVPQIMERNRALKASAAKKREQQAADAKAAGKRRKRK